jgi:flagellar basal-body rod protein FlgF
MIQGIYIASMGMTPLLQKQDQIANNLANVNTTGFKQSGLFLKSYQKFLANDSQQPFVNSEIKADEVYVDYSPGSMRQTGSSLDACLNGSGFFSIMTANEGVQYTRNGNFSLSPDGYLITSDGSKVLGKNGFIRVDTELPVQISENGEVRQKNEIKGEMKIVDFKKPYKMQRCGESRFRPLLPDNPEVNSPGFVVRQGYLETSNVDIIKNMVQMISAYRNFESDQKALQAQDETLQRSVNDVGKIG